VRTMTRLILCIAASTALGSGGDAFALKIIQWRYENIAAFSTIVSTDPAANKSDVNTAGYTIAGSPASPIVGDPTKVSWGTPATATEQSRLRLDSDKDSGFAQTDDVFVPDLTLFHDNFVITGETGGNAGVETSATLISVLLLQSQVGPLANFGPLVRTLDFRIAETPENAGTCPIGCPDIFILTASSAPSFDLGIVDGYRYSLNTEILGLEVLAANVCADVGIVVVGPCLGFSTPEYQTTKLETRFRITSAAVPPIETPEPSMLTLLGLGLAALGFRR
jgi:hypothetical protein